MWRILRWTAAVTGVACALSGTAALGELVRLEIQQRLPYANGRSFDGIGPYQRLVGRAYFELDPDSEANATVVDLDLAPRGDHGRVRFTTEFEILAPQDVTHASGTLLYGVNNRGNRRCLDYFNRDADEFLMQRGTVVVWSGWIAEVLPGGGRLRLEAPLAYENGAPLVSLVRAEMTPSNAATRLSIAHWSNQGSYPPTERGRQSATLTWRLRQADARVPIPRDQWRFESQYVEADRQRGQLPLVELVMPGGFQPGYIYELIYEAHGSVVQGTGLAGIRDIVSFLRYNSSKANPLLLPGGTSSVARTIGWGISQSGRCLRMFLYDGFNADEAGRQVFDGLIPHVAGGGLGFFNHRFASPTRHNGQHDHHSYPADVFPFTYGDAVNPFSGQSDGILRRAREADVVPKVMHVQTSAEYWHRAGSLVHTDPLGTRDATVPPEVRIYAIGGAQHGAGSDVPRQRTNGQLPRNPTDYRPVLRALFVALEAWVRDGTTPPESRYPRIEEGTLVGWRARESGWHPLPGIRYPEVIREPEYWNYGPHYASRRWITQHPPLSLGSYRVLVPAYGRDNNERGTLLLPSVDVPLATFVGWNLRDRSIGASDELLGLTGGYIPFAKTAKERQSTGDPREALLERYKDFSDYLRQYKAAAGRLVKDRFLLKEDLPLLVERAKARAELFQP